ncbi:MAG: WG repeat-containing protein [Lewinellaceae bacterium]|nr:WG repeat-containing protein [Lewinellaceae bacterium]
MRLKFLIFLFLIFWFRSLQAQEDEMPVLVDVVETVQTPPSAQPGQFEAAGLLGIRNQAGEVIIPAVYDYLYPEQWATFMLAARDGKYGAIDAHNKVIIPFAYDLLEPTPFWSMNRRIPAEVQTQGIRLIAAKNDVYGILDAAGTAVLPMEYGFIELARMGYFNVQKDGKWGLANRQGEILIPCQFDARISVDIDAGQFIASRDGKWGVLSATQEVLLPFAYDDVQNTGLFYNAIAKDGKYGLWDKKALKVTLPVSLDTLVKMNPRATYWAARKAGRWGLVGPEGAELIPLQFDSIAMPFYGFKNCALVKTGPKAFTVYSVKGERLLPAEYVSIKSYLSSAFIVEDASGKKGMLRPDGSTMLALAFDEIKNGMSRSLFARKGEFFAAFDTTGKQATPFNIKEFTVYSTAVLADGRKLLVGLTKDELPDYTVFDGIEAFDPSFNNFVVSQKKGDVLREGLVYKFRWAAPLIFENVQHIPVQPSRELQYQGIDTDAFVAMGILPGGKNN